MELSVVPPFPLLLLPLPMKLQQLVERLAATNHLGIQTGWVDLKRWEEGEWRRRGGRGGEEKGGGGGEVSIGRREGRGRGGRMGRGEGERRVEVRVGRMGRGFCLCGFA